MDGAMFSPTKEEKTWGTLYRLVQLPHLELCWGEIVNGGYSSLHRHVRKNNLFLVLQGKLQVNLYVDEKNTRFQKHLLQPFHEALVVPAGTWHRFIALENTTLLEAYQPLPEQSLDPFDIERLDTNGILTGPVHGA